MPVHPWWSPAQSLTLLTARHTARAERGISSLLDPKGWEQTQRSPIWLLFMFLRFCQKSGPKNFSSSVDRLTVTFRSNMIEEGEGAECSIACSDLTPTEQATTGLGRMGGWGTDLDMGCQWQLAIVAAFTLVIQAVTYPFFRDIINLIFCH